MQEKTNLYYVKLRKNFYRTPLFCDFHWYFNSKSAMENFIKNFSQSAYPQIGYEIIKKGKCKWCDSGILAPF